MVYQKEVGWGMGDVWDGDYSPQKLINPKWARNLFKCESVDKKSCGKVTSGKCASPYGRLAFPEQGMRGTCHTGKTWKGRLHLNKTLAP